MIQHTTTIVRAVDWLLGESELKALLVSDKLLTSAQCAALFHGLSAVHVADARLIDEAILGRVARLLVAAEAQVGGPYYTKNGKKKVVEVLPNAAIGYFLRLVAQPLPNIETFLTENTNKAQEVSLPWEAVQARAVHRAQGEEDIAIPAGAWKVSSLLAATLALAHKPYDRTAVQKLTNSQQPNGAWPAEEHDGMTYDSITVTAEALLALVRHQPQKHKPKPTAQSTVQLHSQRVYDVVVAQARTHCRTFSEPLRSDCLAAIDKVCQASVGQEIVLFAFSLERSLKHAGTLPQETLVQLGLANLYNWIAYTIYDDLLDDEGTLALLPVANVALRASYRAFCGATDTANQFAATVGETFDRLDGANAWELQHCRFKVEGERITLDVLPHFGSRLVLAERAFSHALPPLGVIVASGVDLQSPAGRALWHALQHYLIARQLNDDLHDWEEDVRRGHISYVVAEILATLKLRTHTIAFDVLLPQMRQVFWYDTLDQVCKNLTHHTTLARRYAKRSGILQPDNNIAQLTGKLDALVRHNKQQQAQVSSFLQAYGG